MTGNKTLSTVLCPDDLFNSHLFGLPYTVIRKGIKSSFGEEKKMKESLHI